MDISEIENNPIAIEAINHYLSEVIAHSYKCQHCFLYHPKRNYCLYAYECIKDDYCFYKEDE